MNKKITSVAIGSAFAASLVTGSALATENPFEMNSLDSGYQIAMSGKADEGKCGEGKAKEAKCGEGKAKEAKCGEGKAKEAKCGEGKAKEAKCGAK